MTIANGSALPPIAALDIEGDSVDLADAVSGTWAVVILYRGHW